jgi:glycerophosphoryl diester phosphodiesterase
MNTIRAFELAADYGADGVELDVMFSRDGQVVVIHDETMMAPRMGTAGLRTSRGRTQGADAGRFKGEAFAGSASRRWTKSSRRLANGCWSTSS